MLPNVFGYMPRGRVGEVSLMLKAFYTSESVNATKSKAKEAGKKLKEKRLGSVAKCVGWDIEETLAYYGFSSSHWRRVRT